MFKTCLDAVQIMFDYLQYHVPNRVSLFQSCSIYVLIMFNSHQHVQSMFRIVLVCSQHVHQNIKRAIRLHHRFKGARSLAKGAHQSALPSHITEHHQALRRSTRRRQWPSVLPG